MLRILRAIIVAVVFCLVYPVFAEEKSPAGNPPDGDSAGSNEKRSNNRTIEEIKVTADRTESTVQKTSIAVTAINMLMMEEFGIRNQEDLQNYVPSIVVQPYDISIRGVGRNFRSLGGDPGVAVYVDNVYQEDFFTAAAQNGMYDLERIEFLRGPQGTLYGRNGIGGAVNFHNSKPENQFSAEIRGLFGTYNVQEYYGYITGPIIEDKLAGRFVFSDQKGDGYVDDVSGNGDLDGMNDESYAISFTFEPTETLHFYVRGHGLKRDRMIAGSQGLTISNAIVVGENGGLADEINGNKRNTSSRVFGLRPVDPGVACQSLIDRSIANCAVPDQHIFEYNWQGLQRFGQRVVPGVDTAPSINPNPLYQHNADLVNAIVIGDGTDVPKIDGSDLKADTNGFNLEAMELLGGTFIVEWEASDAMTLKYIFGYTDVFYERDLDSDNSSSATYEQLYVNQDNENFQHELQVFADIGDNFVLTAGLFYYESHIGQRANRYTGNPGLSGPAYGTNPSTGEPFTGAEVSTILLGGPIFPPGTPGLFTARDGPCLPTTTSPIPLDSSLESLTRETVVTECFAIGFRGVEDVASVKDGPQTTGDSFLWDTKTDTRSKAVFAQLEWIINDRFSLTAGARWAEDEKRGVANSWIPIELALNNFAPGLLLAYNQLTGALNPDGTPTDTPGNYIRYQGFPFLYNIYRELDNTWEQTTWRLNLDYLHNDSTLVYTSVTTGYRSGGFNLGFVSALPVYDNEELISYEIGVKTRLFKDRLQVNSALYRYDYENIHIQFPTAGDSVSEISLSETGSRSVRGAPEARNQGFEIETTWLATDALDVGFTYSYADVRYTKELIDPRTGGVGVIDNNNSAAPVALYTQAERRIPLNGQRLLHVPKNKASAYLKYRWLLRQGNLVFVSTYSWIDEVVFDITAGALETAPAWGRWDVRLSFRSGDTRWNVTAFVHNVMDEIGVRDVGTGDEATNYARAVTTTTPRFAGIDIRYRLGAY